MSRHAQETAGLKTIEGKAKLSAALPAVPASTAPSPSPSPGVRAPASGVPAESKYDLPALAGVAHDGKEPEGPYTKAAVAYFLEIEAQYQPPADILTRQTLLAPEDHQRTVDGLSALRTKLRLSSLSFTCAVNMTNRLLGLRRVTPEQLRRIAVSALYGAAKSQEKRGSAPSAPQVVAACDMSWEITEESLLHYETLLLRVVGCHRCVPSTLRFAERFLELADAADWYRKYVHYFVEMTYMDTRFLHHLPSKLGAAAVYLALQLYDYRKVVQPVEFTWAGAQSEARCSASALKPVAEEIRAFILTPNAHGFDDIREKFSLQVPEMRSQHEHELEPELPRWFLEARRRAR